MAEITVYTRAYNTEKYIEQCIQSVLSQTFTDFEYIIVDNGSTDKTKDVIERYSQKDNRIRRIRFEENRVGVLNEIITKGISGKYFVTLDSDDWYEVNFLETMYYFAENNNLDISICGSKFHYIESGKTGYRKADKEIVLPKNKYAYYFRHYHQFFRTIWAKLFKTEKIMKSDFTYMLKNNEVGEYGSDTLFSMAVFSASNKIGISDKVLHNYRVHDKSSSYIYYKKRINSDILLFENAEKFLKMFGEISKDNYYFLHLVYLYAIKDTIYTLLKSIFKISDVFFELNRILKQSLTQQMLQYLCNDKRLIIFKKEIVDVIIKQGQKELNNSIAMSMIHKTMCLLFEEFEDYIDEHEMNMHIAKSGYMGYIIKVEDKSLFNDNIFLKWIDNEEFLFHYHEIIKYVYFKDFNNAISKIIEVLINETEIMYKEELLQLCLNLSAETQNSDIFIIMKKLQTEHFIQVKKYDEAKEALNDLLDMHQNDEDVVVLKRCLEEEYE